MGVLLGNKMTAKKGRTAYCQALFHSPITTFSPPAPRARLLEHQRKSLDQAAAEIAAATATSRQLLLALGVIALALGGVFAVVP